MGAVRSMVIAAGLLCLASCEMLPGGALFSTQTAVTAAEAEEHRLEYQTSRKSAELRWLLAHCVKNGMTVEEVGQALGESGEREYRDQRYKLNSRTYLVNDEMHRFGPDDQGRSFLLGFRNGTLVNFDPNAYADDDPEAEWKAGAISEETETEP